MLRIDVPGGATEDDLEHVAREKGFERFDRSGLAFLYQERTAIGEDSTFIRLVDRT